MLQSTDNFFAGTIKAATLIAVAAFLFAITGCHHTHARQHDQRQIKERSSYQQHDQHSPVRRRRRRAEEYSRIPANYPASWQHQSVGY